MILKDLKQYSDTRSCFGSFFVITFVTVQPCEDLGSKVR